MTQKIKIDEMYEIFSVCKCEDNPLKRIEKCDQGGMTPTVWRKGSVYFHTGRFNLVLLRLSAFHKVDRRLILML